MDGFAESVVYPSTQSGVFHRDILFLLMRWWFSCSVKLDAIPFFGYFPDSYDAWFSASYLDVPICNKYENWHTHSSEIMITFKSSVLKL